MPAKKKLDSSFTNYSNESFESFQAKLAIAYHPDDLIWIARDGLFTQAFYDHEKNKNPIFNLPLSDVAYLVRNRFIKSNSKCIDQLEKVDTCIIIPSSRSNHLGRLLPYMNDKTVKYGVITTTNCKLDFNNNQIIWEHDPCTGAAKKARPLHYYLARTQMSKFYDSISIDFTAKQKRFMTLYLCEFHVWVELWTELLKKCDAKQIVSTFECSASGKALFFSAKQLGIQSRIHWYGGMRHAILQSTLSTELWCQTQSDVRYFEKKVPEYCKVSVKKNPECQRIADNIGVLDRTQPLEPPLRFLFLGPGANPLYTKDMRLNDLKTLKHIQTFFGDKIVWRMRPHPSRIERFVSELHEVGIVADDISTRDLYEDLKWAHAVGTGTSSLLLDLIDSGRYLFWIQAELRNISSVNEHVSDGIGVHLDLSNAKQELNKILNQQVV